MTGFIRGCWILAAAGAAFGQTFDVATVKPSPPPQMAPGGRGQIIMMGARGGPGTNDPGRWTCNNCNMMLLMTQAYGVQRYELSVPSAMDNERFDITAKVPEGTTKDQFKVMQQNLLVERFKLALHRENKETQVYELTVAKGGPKMKEAAPVEAPKPATDTAPDGKGLPTPSAPVMFGPGQIKMDKDGFPILPMPQGAGRGNAPRMMMMNGRARMQADQESMDDFAKYLSNQLGKPVTDGTGLTGKYEFTLTFDGSSLGGGGRGFGPGGGGGGLSMQVQTAGPGGGGGGGDTPLGASNDEPTAPTLFAAVQSQLGLKLDQKKGQIEIIVVDHVEKVPTEN